MKLVSMKMSKKEARRESGLMAPEKLDDLPKYPYELRIRLDTESLDKLKISLDDLKVGQKVTVSAEAEIISIDTRQSQNGGERNNLELQITDMACEFDEADKKDKRAEHLKEMASATR